MHSTLSGRSTPRSSSFRARRAGSPGFLAPPIKGTPDSTGLARPRQVPFFKLIGCALTAEQELDVDELIANREDMHTQLGMMTKRLQLQQFAGLPAGGSFSSILPEIRDEEHQEFMISDGSKVHCLQSSRKSNT
jgi:hypothetical protein